MKKIIMKQVATCIVNGQLIMHGVSDDGKVYQYNEHESGIYKKGWVQLPMNEFSNQKTNEDTQ